MKPLDKGGFIIYNKEKTSKGEKLCIILTLFGSILLDYVMIL